MRLDNYAIPTNKATIRVGDLRPFHERREAPVVGVVAELVRELQGDCQQGRGGSLEPAA